mgnify:CR=1 FL=1
MSFEVNNLNRYIKKVFNGAIKDMHDVGPEIMKNQMGVVTSLLEIKYYLEIRAFTFIVPSINKLEDRVKESVAKALMKDCGETMYTDLFASNISYVYNITEDDFPIL